MKQRCQKERRLDHPSAVGSLGSLRKVSNEHDVLSYNNRYSPQVCGSPVLAGCSVACWVDALWNATIHTLPGGDKATPRRWSGLGSVERDFVRGASCSALEDELGIVTKWLLRTKASWLGEIGLGIL